MKPQLILAVADAQGNEVLAFPPTPRRRVVSEKTAALVAGMLREAVGGENGNTGKNANIPGYAVAGKTGTTQKIVNGKYSNEFYVASFSGFFPADNPRIVITVVIDGPTYYAERWIAKRDARGKVMRYPNGTMMMEKKRVRTRAYGGSVAAPVFREVAEKIIRWLEIPPSAAE